MKDGTRDLKGVLGDNALTPFHWVFVLFVFSSQVQMTIWKRLILSSFKMNFQKMGRKTEYESMNNITSPSRRTPGEQKGQHKSHQLLLMQPSLRSEMLSLKTVYTHRGRWIQTLYSSGNCSKLKGKEWELNPYQNVNHEDMTSSRHI